MRMVITGANSFVAQSIIKKCDQFGIDWIGLDVSGNSNCKIFQCDIRNENIKYYLKKGDCIIHLAAISSDKLANYDVNACYDVNVTGTLNLFNRAIEAGANKFIFASTEWVYGDNCEIILTEDDFPSLANLKSEYAKSKLLSEFFLNARTNEAIEIVILRFGILFGVRNKNLSAFESIIQNCINLNEVIIGSKKTARRFIDVDDVAKYIVTNYSSIISNTYNITSKNLISLEELIEVTGKLLNKKIKIVERNPKDYTIRNIYSKYDHIKSIENCELELKVSKIIKYFTNNE